MNFPEKTTFKFLDKITKRPVSNIATLLTLYAHRKNNYSVGIKISDDDGLVSFSKEDCLKEIKNSWNFHLMDHSSTLEQCLPKISLETMKEEWIRRAINDRRKLRHLYKDAWDCSEEFLKRLESVDNAKYIYEEYHFTEKELWQNKILEIEVEKISENRKR